MPDMDSGSTRQQILAAAEQIMTKRPYESTISEIASSAGVADSVIYHYFKNKEDLLVLHTGRAFERGDL